MRDNYNFEVEEKPRKRRGDKMKDHKDKVDKVEKLMKKKDRYNRKQKHKANLF